MTDVFLKKRDIINRCLQRIEEEYGGDPARLKNQTHQDAAVLNLLRACETVIDLAMHLVAEKKLSTPAETREAFDSLEQVGILSPKLAKSMRGMVGFRTLIVHTYQEARLEVIQSILDKHLNDFKEFVRAAGKALNES